MCTPCTAREGKHAHTAFKELPKIKQKNDPAKKRIDKAMEWYGKEIDLLVACHFKEDLIGDYVFPMNQGKILITSQSADWVKNKSAPNCKKKHRNILCSWTGREDSWRGFAAKEIYLNIAGLRGKIHKEKRHRSKQSLKANGGKTEVNFINLSE
ncbi:Hypothetical predicted protein [Podarcis lilfordi]|uniref:Uncharacterized protein n=1 Tax=Podarcis lilfordi TaxID=74358 RepID=A0AA35NSQ8_9SAUR|nr:Hypothetical predicted protein [Podarcis lilfordi]